MWSNRAVVPADLYMLHCTATDTLRELHQLTFIFTDNGQQWGKLMLYYINGNVLTAAQIR